MIDPDLKTYLAEINQNLVKLARPSKWTALIHGMLTGLGYVIGVAIAIAAIGWILNFVGVIPAMKAQVDKWQQIIEQTQQQYKTSPINNQKK